MKWPQNRIIIAVSLRRADGACAMTWDRRARQSIRTEDCENDVDKSCASQELYSHAKKMEGIERTERTGRGGKGGGGGGGGEGGGGSGAGKVH